MTGSHSLLRRPWILRDIESTLCKYANDAWYHGKLDARLVQVIQPLREVCFAFRSNAGVHVVKMRASMYSEQQNDAHAIVCGPLCRRKGRTGCMSVMAGISSRRR